MEASKLHFTNVNAFNQTRQRADTSSTDANQTIHMEWEGGGELLGV